MSDKVSHYLIPLFQVQRTTLRDVLSKVPLFHVRRYHGNPWIIWSAGVRYTLETPQRQKSSMTKLTPDKRLFSRRLSYHVVNKHCWYRYRNDILHKT
jgi:hypothetical protein